jgi:hypothetical protein
MPTDPRVETIRLLASIDATLKAMLLVLSGKRNDAPATSDCDIADDADLDSQWGDEVVKFQPRDWTGANFKGAKMSSCPAEFLEQLANAFDYFAKKNDADKAMTDKGQPKSMYDRRSARRARGWAQRARNGETAPQAPAEDWSAQEPRW